MPLIEQMTTHRPATAVSPHLTYNLLNDFETLAALLRSELAALVPNSPAQDSTEGIQVGSRGVLNAFLYAAGMTQILDDYLHRDVYASKKVAATLERVSGRVGRASGGAVRSGGHSLYRLRNTRHENQRLVQWHIHFDRVVEMLAAGVMASAADAMDTSQVVASLSRLLDQVATMPAGLRHDIVRLPSCFRNFDQHPQDCQRIADDYAVLRPDRSVPVLVIGLRTSGSYLAPLYGAAFRAIGYERVRSMSMRPGQWWLQHEQALLAEHVRCGGRVLVADDPPASGSAFAKAARELQRLGVPSEAITLLVPLFGAAESLPAKLSEFEAICLPLADWHVNHLLREEAVSGTLQRLLVGQRLDVTREDGQQASITVEHIAAVTRLALAFPEEIPAANPYVRGHIRARYQVDLIAAESGERVSHHVYVKGVGQGYFGDLALAVSEALPHFVPPCYGADEGLLFRRWMPEQHRLAERQADPSYVERVVEYIVQRRESLPVTRDVSAELVGRQAIWQRGADLLMLAFGRAAPVARPALHALAKRILLADVSRPAVIDGSMLAAQWFRAAADADMSSLRKVDFDEAAFSNFDLYTYDPVFDLASAAVGFAVPGEPAHKTAERFRRAYTQRTGERISDERWLLYQLIVLTVREQYLRSMLDAPLTPGAPAVSGMSALPGASAPPAISGIRDQGRASSTSASQVAVVRELDATTRNLSRVHEWYMGNLYCADLRPPADGPLCAIDIDGVLETGWISYTSITPAGALALRALTRHGYRPVLVTGRCAEEVRERCAAYHLAGGVAEYGAVVYNAATDETRVLLTPRDRADLDALRTVLRTVDGVFLDVTYGVAVRAYRLKHGQRRGLESATIAAALSQVPNSERIRTIIGHDQTDFMVAHVDKATGIAALADVLGVAASGRYLAFAAGDSVSDLPMLALARCAVAPANADSQVRAAARDVTPPPVHIMPATYQAGLLQGVAELLGHGPGNCALCRTQPVAGDAAHLLSALSAQDVGARGKVARGVFMLRALTPRTIAAATGKARVRA